MIRLQRALLQLDVDLRRLDFRFALIGGLAVSVRAEPRTTQALELIARRGFYRDKGDLQLELARFLG